MKINHERIGLLSEDGNEIIGYVHERHKVGECSWCDHCRADNIAKEFVRRLRFTGLDCRNLYMWSLGSSMHDTKYNRKRLLRYWQRLRARFAKSGYWPAVFRVVEVGRRGFLHIHFVAIDFIPHQKMLEIWRSLTGEKSNVHVSGQKGAQDVVRLTRYLTKYLTKETSSYRWLGPLYGLGKSRPRTMGKGRRAIYGGICYGGYKTEQHISKYQDAILQTPLVPEEVNSTNGEQISDICQGSKASN